MLGEIPMRFKGTVEDFLSQAYYLSTYKNPYGPFRMYYPEVMPGVSVRISIGENGWALAQRSPNGGCVVSVGVEGEDEAMWQRLYAHLERWGFWDTGQDSSKVAERDSVPATIDLHAERDVNIHGDVIVGNKTTNQVIE